MRRRRGLVAGLVAMLVFFPAAATARIVAADLFHF
jgi:hypothetical protein